jgi:hypothetical protein
MQENKNLLMYLLINDILLIGLLVVANPVIIDKISDRVVKVLQRDYSPSPYGGGPSINPDRIDMNKIKKN